MKIWKFPLALIELQIVRLPEEAAVLSVAVQNGKVCMWAMVSPERPTVERVFRVAGTGHVSR